MSAFHINAHVLVEPRISLHPVSRLVPIHGASESSLPATEGRDVFHIRAASTALGCSLGQVGFVDDLQPFQLFLGPPEACSGGQRDTLVKQH